MIKDKNILIKNIYYMLSYAFCSLQMEEEKNISAENFDNFHDLFAAILSHGIGRQLKQGIYKEYITFQEDLPTVRGKIDLRGTIKNKFEKKRIISCEFDELSENNLLNQILKTTVFLLLRHGNVKSEYKSQLRKEMLFFSNVDEINPSSIEWSSICFHRNNQSYRILISICQLIVEGMLLTTDQGEIKLAEFLDDQRMCRLYEKFILEYYRKEHPEISANASRIPWMLDDGVGTLLPIMQSDILLENKEGNILIIDAKYYNHSLVTNRFDTETIRSNHLYQIFTYVKNKDYELKDKHCKVSGMLLYAKTEDELQPDHVYQMSGNTISVKNLDLNKSFNEIKRILDGIVLTM